MSDDILDPAYWDILDPAYWPFHPDLWEAWNRLGILIHHAKNLSEEIHNLAIPGEYAAWSRGAASNVALTRHISGLCHAFEDVLRQIKKAFGSMQISKEWGVPDFSAYIKED
jgi:hypothetical protein